MFLIRLMCGIHFCVLFNLCLGVIHVHALSLGLLAQHYQSLKIFSVTRLLREMCGIHIMGNISSLFQVYVHARDLCLGSLVQYTLGVNACVVCQCV